MSPYTIPLDVYVIQIPVNELLIYKEVSREFERKLEVIATERELFLGLSETPYYVSDGHVLVQIYPKRENFIEFLTEVKKTIGE